MDYVKTAAGIAAHIRGAVRPHLGTPAARGITGTASSGDATFNIDNVAEEAVLQYIERNGLNVAVYTEDEGLKEFGKPEAVLIIDPIDGTRPAAAGFESCVVSVAVAKCGTEVRMKDVVAGCIYEIKYDRLFTALKGDGAKVFCDEKGAAVTPSTVTSITNSAWTAEVAGRPFDKTGVVLRDVLAASSITGGFFVLNSTAFSLSRLVTGQLSAVVDVAGRMLKQCPWTRDNFLQAGKGRVIGLFPYDFAAAAFIAMEAGCVVTDAWGNSLDEVDLLDSSEGNIQSILASSTPEVHEQFLRMIDEGFRRLSDESGS
ncbi:MAG: inositol monophosphatase family protein [Armatimonadota bacterium]|jgi:myo-inositol-1(or 4)-monophosphatase